MTGFLASSKAGHDKDKIYVIIREDAEYVWLADGKTKLLSNPKKKNKKHVQPVKYFYDAALKDALEENREVSDFEIMMVLKEYKNKQM